MNDHLDPEKLKIPAYMRKKAIVRQSRQKLILTALDRKQAGLSVHSQKALAPMKSVKVKEKTYSNIAKQPKIKKSRATSFFNGPNQPLHNRFLGDVSQIPPRQKQPARSLLRSLLPLDEPEQEMETRTQLESRPRHEAPTGFVEIHRIGHVTAYFDKIQVAVIKLEKPLRIGDIIQIAAEDMLFQQPVDSMQINRKPVKIARKGSEIGLKVSMEPELNGPVYKVQL